MIPVKQQCTMQYVSATFDTSVHELSPCTLPFLFCFHHILMPAAILYHVRMLPTYDLEDTGKMREKARIKQSETFSLWEKPNSPGAQEQAPRGNRTQVKKACVTATAQLVP